MTSTQALESTVTPVMTRSAHLARPASGANLLVAHLQLLGGFELRHGGRPVRVGMAAQRLLAFAALHDSPILRVHVAGTLWPDMTDGRASANLRSVLWRLGLSKVGVLGANATHVWLAPEVEVDLQSAQSGARRLMGGDVDCVDDVAHFSVDLLPDWYEDWLVPERERFRQLRLHALEATCGRLVELGRFGDAAVAALLAIKSEPLRDSAQEALIRTYLAEGNRVEAIRAYQVFRSQLNDELGLEPSPSLRELLNGLPVE